MNSPMAVAILGDMGFFVGGGFSLLLAISKSSHWGCEKDFGKILLTTALFTSH